MAFECRICRVTNSERWISITRKVSEHRKRVSGLIADVCGSQQMEQNDRSPQQVCHGCFTGLFHTYSLKLQFRVSLQMFDLNPATDIRCFLCSVSTKDGKGLVPIDSLYEKRNMKLRDMIEQLSGEHLDEDSWLKYLCKVCRAKLDSAYGLRRKCLESERMWVQKSTFPWEKMLIDSSNPDHLICDLYAEVVQGVGGKAHCSVCLLTVDSSKEHDKRCRGCRLEFRKCNTMDAKAVLSVISSVGESDTSRMDVYFEVEENSEPDDEGLDTNSVNENPSCSLEMEHGSEEVNAEPPDGDVDADPLNVNGPCSLEQDDGVEEENPGELCPSADQDDDDEHFEINPSKVAKPTSDHVGYVEEPEKLFYIFEDHPGDPYPTVLRKGPCCCKCFLFFATKSDLADHQTQNHASSTGTGKFFCDVCLTLYDNRQALDDHRKSLDTFVYDYCRSCRVVLESPQMFRQHKWTYHMDMKAIKEAESRFDTERVLHYVCCMHRCYNRYASEDRLRKHFDVAHSQTDQEPMPENSCQYCKRVFRSELTLMNHWRFEKEQYRCRAGGCGFMRTEKKIMWQHCTQKPHSKTYSETKVLVPDMKHFTVIGKLDSITDTLRRNTDFCCRCFLVFETEEELAAHCELHVVEADKPFQCQICRKSFTKVGLAIHKRMQDIPTHFYCRPCKTFLWRKMDYVHHKEASHLYDDDLSSKIETKEDHSTTCCGCSSTFQEEKELIEHRRKHHPPPKVPAGSTRSVTNPKCDDCHRYMPNMEALEKHIAFYESRAMHSCKVPECEFQTKDMDQMRLHILHGVHKDNAGAIVGIKSTGPDDYRCCVRDCRFRSLDYDEMIKHGQAEHRERREQLAKLHCDQPLACPVCCKGFDLEITLYRHKHNKKKQKCNGCQKEFHQEEFSAHVAQCTEKSIQCDICDRVMSSKSTLQKHMSTIHSVPTDGTKPGWHVCSICGKQIKKISIHMQKHENKRAWQCSTCGARFNNPVLLKNHARTHSNERNFPCRQGCDKKYKNPGDRDRHERAIHLGIKPFACAICKESFVRERDLRLHQRKHSGRKLFPCSYCNSSFDVLREFEEHCTTHDGSASE